MGKQIAGYGNMYRKQTLKEGGYTYKRYLGHGEHLLYDNDTNQLEIWFANKNHAGYGLIYKNTHLEFARGYKEKKNG